MIRQFSYFGGAATALMIFEQIRRRLPDAMLLRPSYDGIGLSDPILPTEATFERLAVLDRRFWIAQPDRIERIVFQPEPVGLPVDLARSPIIEFEPSIIEASQDICHLGRLLAKTPDRHVMGAYQGTVRSLRHRARSFWDGYNYRVFPDAMCIRTFAFRATLHSINPFPRPDQQYAASERRKEELDSAPSMLQSRNESFDGLPNRNALSA